MAAELGGLTETAMVKTMEDAVHLAYRTAKKGDVVLLSPACSDFDIVQRLPGERKSF